VGRSIGGQTAIVVGAGPAGLIAALTLRQEGFADVAVFERRAAFTRGNVVNLHPESLHVLARLGVLPAFFERASRIVDHRNNVWADGVELYRFSDPGQPVTIDPDHPFEAADVADGFRNETLYSITLAELQSLLAAEASKRGIQVFARAPARVVPASSGVFSVRVEPEAGAPFVVEGPDLVVVADGAKGTGAVELGLERSPGDGLWDGERWVFGNVRCEPHDGFSNLLFEFRGLDCDDVTITNSIFLPAKGEANVAVTVRRDVSSAEAEALIAAQARKVLAIAGVDGPGDVVWHTARPVEITATSARRVHFGRNVVVVGDACGSNSPVAALGGTLSTSAYSYALRCLVRDLAVSGHEAAFAAYARRVGAYVLRWHHRVAEVRQTLEAELRPTSTRLLAAPVRALSGTGDP